MPFVSDKPEVFLSKKPKASHGKGFSGKPSYKNPSAKGEPLEDDAAGLPYSQTAPEAPQGSVPQMSVAPRPSDSVVLPPVTVPHQQSPRTNANGQMTLVSPTATDDKGDGTDWAVVLGIVLIAEIGLLWGAACVGLWRRRLVLRRFPDPGTAE
ncbi:hypothetical protein [Actinomadura terrae]|uniref:hypothetical protein n=1 Tax=Actinomadura terrae TaxID=604353 RepID=UPI001FA80108|nr:hypothetical protein [Actinomadura terrae]